MYFVAEEAAKRKDEQTKIQTIVTGYRRSSMAMDGMMGPRTMEAIRNPKPLKRIEDPKPRTRILTAKEEDRGIGIDFPMTIATGLPWLKF